ncbi:hypothetical protein JCM19235_1313 [Vibrio maritimus]|uniref:Uncharacterized protein n=1 Tax=Vibrio maritimus TaxID=990268 RepID=A0A090SUM6_9VIBR|nr:hypothetical protein JCM19235_1313 [Vibrio maritimus]
MPYDKSYAPEPDRTEIQRKWRDKKREFRSKHQVVFNLNEMEIAIIDAIASQLYEDFPHNPPREVANKHVGRQAAIERLIHNWYGKCSDEEEGLVMEMCDRRLANGEFFRKEATWRRCKNPKRGLDKEIEKPVTPWKRNPGPMETADLFRMVSETAPMNSKRWFENYIEGSVFAAKDIDDANEWIQEQCRVWGTDTDPFYDDLGPTAVPYNPQQEQSQSD